MVSPYAPRNLYLGARTRSWNLATHPMRIQLCGYEELSLVVDETLEIIVEMDFDMDQRNFPLNELFVNSDPSCPITNYTLKQFESLVEGDGLIPDVWMRNF